VPSRASSFLGAIVYGALVFLGTAGLGFVVAPALGHASGLFPFDKEAQAVFSLLTLKAVPFLFGLSVAAAFYHPGLARLSVWRRVIVYAATVVLTWVAGATIAVFILG
jgi:hypothetical protein